MTDSFDPAPRTHAITRDSLERWFRGGAFVVLLLLGAVATVRAYFAVETAILTWLQPQWIPIAQAVFSLATVAIVVWLIRVWIIGRART